MVASGEESNEAVRQHVIFVFRLLPRCCGAAARGSVLFAVLRRCPLEAQENDGMTASSPASPVSVGHFRFLEKWTTLPPLCAAFVGLHGRKGAGACPKTTNLSPESPPAKFQYPNLFGGDSVRECRDWCGLSLFGS